MTRFAIFTHHVGNFAANLGPTQTPCVHTPIIAQIITSFIKFWIISCVISTDSSLKSNRPPQAPIESLNSVTKFNSTQLNPFVSIPSPDMANLSHRDPFK